ncbi:SDR family oxidoreductase [Cohnella thailandensis]|uniref:SDR family NAD(P)-dependent oxidoreductase n=1 Tax=Cohnella thailandensis TaxID=557557 RepID=A0A841T6L8_9BACL|nr:SDR family oxidoreductase [Cohnella thailandensis]MBB6637938.1 SDR family NAD(P)-dependent oxidoreductase [Cohnella thailandensis]MBP1977724.1 NAD(P)-dependent dehydrogenase (short-subunit alcohol dehydrogenase family) [Cohnella thailandensis]
MKPKALEGKVAVVAGATRGAGRAIAETLGEAGAIVYCTGRSSREGLSDIGRSETIEETAERVTAKGGTGIAVRVDHTEEAQVVKLFERVAAEQAGRLDLLVNDIWGGDPLSDWNKKFWEHDLGNGLLIQKRAVMTHMINSWHAAPLLIARGSGLIVEVTDGWDYRYRGNLYYSLAKISAIHLAEAMAADLAGTGVSAVAVTPGFLRSEAMLDHFGVSEENWEDGVRVDPNFIMSETPYFVGRAIAELAADPAVASKSGKALTSWDLSEEYGFSDIDGRRPHWGRYAKEKGFYD